MSASLYEPIQTYKALSPRIGIVDGPLEFMTVAGLRFPLPFTTRMTVVRLSSGDLFLHSPIRYDARLAEQLERLGPVKHLVSPTQFHYAHIGEWARHFPEARCWASPGVRKRAKARGVKIEFFGNLANSPAAEWAPDLDQVLLPGGYFKEYVFFHRASSTLVLTDGIINIDPEQISQPWRAAVLLTGMYAPKGAMFFGMRLPYLMQRRRRKEFLEKLRFWQPDRILLSHGRYFEDHGREVLQRIFGA